MTDGPDVPGEVTNLTAAEWTKFWDTGRGPLVPHARAAVLVALSLMAIVPSLLAFEAANGTQNRPP